MQEVCITEKKFNLWKVKSREYEVECSKQWFLKLADSKLSYSVLPAFDTKGNIFVTGSISSNENAYSFGTVHYLCPRPGLD